RGQGIASEMMKHLFANLAGQHVYLWTDDAQGFYKKLNMHEDDATGFSKVVGNWLENPNNDETE
ncbi:MAG: GNAT family N-acetyltransferase, partial [Chloroflexota bacterium]